MVRKLGKKKFVEFVTHSRSGETMAERRRKTRWGTPKMTMCSHGVWIVEDYKPNGKCKVCNRAHKVTKLPNFEPHFNLGLGGWIESRSDLNRIVRETGVRSEEHT